MKSQSQVPVTQLSPVVSISAKADARWRSVALTWAPLVPFGLIVLIAIVGPWLVPYSATNVVGPSSQPPSSEHWFGTDSAGMDVFSRVIAATRQNLVIAVMVAIVATAVGVALGLLIGMNESRPGLIGLLSRGVSRAVDLVQAVPALLLGLVAVSLYGSTQTTLILAIALILAPIQVRLVRTEVLRVRSEPYLDAARMAGRTEAGLTFRHVLPNSSWAALENSTVVFALSIVLTAALGFIGVGLAPPTPEWGVMLARGATDAIVGRWWSATFPALALALTTASVAFAARPFFGQTHGSR